MVGGESVMPSNPTFNVLLFPLAQTHEAVRFFIHQVPLVPFEKNGQEEQGCLSVPVSVCVCTRAVKILLKSRTPYLLIRTDVLYPLYPSLKKKNG